MAFFFVLLGLDDAVKAGEEENTLVTLVLVEQPLALPGSDKHLVCPR